MNGILNIYKEAGYTSHDVVAKLRGILKQKKIGHTGTLDPQATGVLPVCLGKATKLCDVIGDWDKTYRATLLLGVKTDTEDIYGSVIERSDKDLSKIPREEISAVISSFVGTYDQVPPMYSAKKVQGKKLYELARQGVEIERKPARVTIYDLQILHMELPYVTLEVHCSKGTYIRSLCRDIGDLLQVGGCMSALERIRVSDFSAADAMTLSKVEEERDKGTLSQWIRPIDSVFLSYPKVTVANHAQKLLQNGNPLYFKDCQMEGKTAFEQEKYLRVYNKNNQFIGLYQPDHNIKKIKPYKLFFDEETRINEIHS